VQADRPQPLAHTDRGPHGRLRLYRVLLQSAPPPLRVGLSQSSSLRKENLQPRPSQPNHRLSTKTGELQLDSRAQVAIWVLRGEG
jgi:hypothetical protein